MSYSVEDHVISDLAVRIRSVTIRYVGKTSDNRVYIARIADVRKLCRFHPQARFNAAIDLLVRGGYAEVRGNCLRIGV